jgi:hypothetical protein
VVFIYLFIYLSTHANFQPTTIGVKGVEAMRGNAGMWWSNYSHHHCMGKKVKKLAHKFCSHGF